MNTTTHPSGLAVTELSAGGFIAHGVGTTTPGRVTVRVWAPLQLPDGVAVLTPDEALEWSGRLRRAAMEAARATVLADAVAELDAIAIAELAA